MKHRRQHIPVNKESSNSHELPFVKSNISFFFFFFTTLVKQDDATSFKRRKQIEGFKQTFVG